MGNDDANHKPMIKFVTILALVLSFSSVRAARASDPNVDRIMVLWTAVQAQIAGIQADEPAMESAYVSYEGWWSQAVAYPAIFTPMQQQAIAGFMSQLNAIVTMQYSQCVSMRDAEQIGKMRHAIRWAMSKPEFIPYALTQMAALDGMLQKCAHFKLKFHSKFTAAGRGGSVIVETKAEFPLATTAVNGNLSLVGYGVLDYVQVKWPSPAGCTVTGMGNGGPISVDSANFGFVDVPGGDLPTDFKMEINIPTTTEQIAIRCPSATTSLSETTWYQAWRGFHMTEESHANTSEYNIAGFDLTLAGEDIATRSYHGAHGLVSEESTMIVAFDPQ
jgi:hypothetical protein